MGQKKRRTSAPGFVPTANPERSHWMRELGKGSTVQPHTPRPRKGTRAEREHQAIRDQGRDRS